MHWSPLLTHIFWWIYCGWIVSEIVIAIGIRTGKKAAASTIAARNSSCGLLSAPPTRSASSPPEIAPPHSSVAPSRQSFTSARQRF